MNIYFILFWKDPLLKHHGFFQTYIHLHVLQRETLECPRAPNLYSSSFSIKSLPIFVA
jgi:hypothetical protein